MIFKYKYKKGCIIFKMFTGQTPFFDHTEYLIFQKIKKVNYSMPEVYE